MKCNEVFDVIQDGVEYVDNNGEGKIACISVLMLLSCGLLFFGAKIVKTLSFIVGSGLGFTSTFAILRVTNANVSCATTFIVSGSVSLVCGLLLLCCLKTGTLLVGGAGLGVATHYVWTALSVSISNAPFYFLDKSAYYYAALLSSSTMGVLLSVCAKKTTLRVSTSCIGGAGLALGVHWSLSVSKAGELPPWGALAIFSASVCVGTWSQTKLQKGRRRRGEERSRL